MATLEKNAMTGEYVVKQNDTLSKIASTQGRTLAELLANNPQYAKNPNLIHPGDVVKFGAATQPSYTNLTSGGNTGNTYTPTQMQDNSATTTSFTKGLVDILKKAQGIDIEGQAKLMKQGQDITGQGLKSAASIFNNPLLTPSAGTSLGQSTQNALNPLNLSIENQQKLATANLGNISDIVKQTQDAYDKEEGRALQAKQDLADAEYKKQTLAETIRAHKADERQKNNPDVDSGDNPQLYTGLTPQTATAVRSQVSQFRNEPSIQNFAVVQEGRNFAGSLSNSTTNPADDQGLIYALAKALDPGSVVREGEYATAQKYSQSWVNAFGKGVTQALLGTGFLSETARKNIKDTIENKYLASKRTYDNLYGQYGNTISTLTGRGDGVQFLKDYSIGQSGGIITAPDGTQVQIID